MHCLYKYEDNRYEDKLSIANTHLLPYCKSRDHDRNRLVHKLITNNILTNVKISVQRIKNSKIQINTIRSVNTSAILQMCLHPVYILLSCLQQHILREKTRSLCILFIKIKSIDVDNKVIKHISNLTNSPCAHGQMNFKRMRDYLAGARILVPHL